MGRILNSRFLNPMKALTLGLVLAVILLPILGSVVWSMYRSLSAMGTEGLRLQRLVGHVAHLNDVLSMSARMAAATGDPRWEKHYRTVQPQLDDAILEVALLLRAEYEKNYAAQTKFAYSRLLEMESVALAMVRQGRLKEASSLLFGEDYEAQKVVYSQGIAQMTAAIRLRIERELQGFHTRIWQVGLLGGLSVAIVILGWAGVSVVVKNHLVRRKQAEQDLAAEKERLLVTLRSIKDGVISSDTSGKAVLLNPAAEMLTGWTQEEAVGRAVSELFGLVSEKTKTACENPVDTVLKTGSACELTNSTLLITRNQTRKFVEHSAAPIRDRSNQTLGVVLVLRDVTTRKQSLNALRESEVKYRTIIENVEEGYYEVDLAGNMVLFNDSMAKILDYARDELTGLNYRQYVPESCGKRVRKTFRSVYLTKKSAQVSDWELSRREGTTRSVEASVAAVIDLEGKPKGFRGIVRDVTERKQLDEQLRQSAKMEAIGTLAGGIAHDFNNILHVIMGFSELALDDAPTAGRLRRNLEQILSAADRAKALVQQILTFSRRSDQKKEAIRVSPLVKETLQFLKASVPSTIELRGSMEAASETILADPSQIHQVLMNLSTNAVHAMRKHGGVLDIRLDNYHVEADPSAAPGRIPPGTYVRLSVSDTGHGMTSDRLEHIFEPYFTTKRRGEGTGLGLSVVHGIVKAHEGHMEVRSEEGRGSVFRVYLPVACEELKPIREAMSAVPGGSGQHILLVDDEPAIVDMSKEMLQQLGYEVCARYDSAEALEVFCDNPRHFDLIITDMDMPKMTGKELAGRLQSVRPDIPIILCTGFSESITQEQAAAMRLDALMTKPVCKAQMAATVRHVLESARPNTSLHTEK